MYEIDGKIVGTFSFYIIENLYDMKFDEGDWLYKGDNWIFLGRTSIVDEVRRKKLGDLFGQ